MEVYAVKQPTGPFQTDSNATSVVKRLIQSIDKFGGNLTIDNFYNSEYFKMYIKITVQKGQIKPQNSPLTYSLVYKTIKI